MIHNILNYLNKLNTKCQCVSSTQLSKYHNCCGGLCHKLVVWLRLLHTHRGVGGGGGWRQIANTIRAVQFETVTAGFVSLFYLQKEKHAQITKQNKICIFIQ